MSLPYQNIDYAAQLEGLNVKGLRIGLLTDMKVGLPAHPEVLEAVQSAAKALAAAGAIVEPMTSYLSSEMMAGMLVFFEARSGNDVAAMSAEQRSRILPFVRGLVYLPVGELHRWGRSWMRTTR